MYGENDDPPPPACVVPRTRELRCMQGGMGVSHTVLPATPAAHSPAVAFLYREGDCDQFVTYVQQGPQVRKKCLSSGAATMLTAVRYDTETRLLADQTGAAFVVDAHQLCLLPRLAFILTNCNVSHNITPDCLAVARNSSTCLTSLQEGEEVEVAADAAKVSNVAVLFPSATPWQPRMYYYCGELAKVVSVDTERHMVTLLHADNTVMCWPVSVCKIVVDTVLEDALTTIEELGLEAPDTLLSLLVEGRGNKRLTLESLRTVVRALDDAEGCATEAFTWHDRQRMLEATAKLQSQRKLSACSSPMSRAFQAPPTYMYVALHALLYMERQHDRLIQAPLLIQAMERCGESALPSSYHHHLLAVVGCTPALWERSAHWAGAKEALLRLDIKALLGADFAPEDATTVRMVRQVGDEQQLSPFMACNWVLRQGAETKRIPTELRQHISEYLIPVATLAALKSRLQQIHQPQDEDEGLGLGTDVYSQAIERVTTVHDKSIMEGCVSLMQKEYVDAKRHFKTAMTCHHTDPEKVAETFEVAPKPNQYVSLLFGSLAQNKNCCFEDSGVGDALSGSVQVSPPPFPFLDQVAEGADDTELQFSPTGSDESLSFAPYQFPSGASSASSSADEELSPHSLPIHSAVHSPTAASPASTDTYCVEECTCGDNVGAQNVFVKVLRSVAESGGGGEWERERSAVRDVAPLEDEDLDCNCCFCLYHTALCVGLEDGIQLLEKAEKLYQNEHDVMRGRLGSTPPPRPRTATSPPPDTTSLYSTPNYSNSCEFTNGMVNLLLGIYYVAKGVHLRREEDVQKVVKAFQAAHSMTGSTLATAWLAKLELRQPGGRQRGRMLLSHELYKMWNSPADSNTPSLFYLDFARLTEARATMYYSIEDINVALVKSPKRPVLHQLKAAMQADMGDAVAAVETLGVSIGFTYQAADLLQRASLSIKLGKLEDAVEDLCACLLFQPSNPKAKALLRRHGVQLKNHPKVLFNDFFSRSGYVKKAACLYKWVHSEPSNPHVYCRISQFFFRLGSKRSVHDYWCTQALEACGSEWAPLFQGLLAESFSDYDLAADLFKEAVRNQPLEYECHLMLAYTLVSLKRYEESTKVLKCAVHLATHPSQCSIIYNNIGYVYFFFFAIFRFNVNKPIRFNYRCVKMYHTALGYFEKSKEYIPFLHYTFFNPFSNASEIYFMMDDQQRAVEEIHAGLNIAIEVRPSMLEELLTKGKFKNVDGFFDLCSQIKALDPYNEFTYRFGAAVMWDTGMMEASLEELDEGIELTLGTQALVMRGELLHHFRLTKKAQDYLAMALLLDPHNEVCNMSKKDSIFRHTF